MIAPVSVAMGDVAMAVQMAFQMTLAQLIQVLAATPVNLAEETRAIDPQNSPNLATVTGITTDSRSVKPGDIFLALRGERFDGHDFVAKAIAQGARVAIVDVAGAAALTGLPLLVVSDTLKAYQAIGRWWRDQFQIPVIAVTGSVGKTTTKELIAAVLATQGKVLKSQANYNNEIGVPKTLLELTADHDFAVVEMGMRAAGEIAELAQIANPDIAVITNVGTAHIGRLGSEQAIASAKCELLAEMKTSGIAVLNHDNDRLMTTAAQVWQGKLMSYGLTGGTLQGNLINPTTLVVDGMNFPLPLPGRHNALNYSAALAVAKILEIDRSPLTQGLQVDLPQGRARRVELPDDIVLLDETYNAGLESMLASLQLLAETPGQRRIAVLGTMKELGDRSTEFHRQVGEMAQHLKLDRLLILADAAESRAMAAGAGDLIAEEFTSAEAVVTRLRELINSGDRVLFKASRAVGLDRVVQDFLHTRSAEAVLWFQSKN